MKISKVIVLIFITSLMISCSGDTDLIKYHWFKNQTWSRFNILRFEIPVNVSEGMYNVSLFIRHTKEFESDDLDFNMIMITPSGEERIKEYHMDIKRKDGSFIGNCDNNACEVTIDLKRQLTLSKGLLSLEIENLVPKMEVREILCIGIRLRPS